MDEKKFYMYLILILIAIIVTDIPAVQNFMRSNLISSNSNIDDEFIHNSDSFVIPYLEAFELNNDLIRRDAALIVRDCSDNDKSCYIREIYYYVINNYNYLPDPKSTVENIQDYFYTKSIKAGECEDLSILMGSLLENIGIKTYFVLTNNHGYILACSEKLDSNLIDPEIISYSKRINLEARESIFIPINEKFTEQNQMTLNYRITSNRLVSIYAIADESNYEKFMNGTSFNHYNACNSLRTSNREVNCRINDLFGLIIENNFNGKTNAHISLNLLQEKSQGINVYDINNQMCIVLDATAGKYGYPGYEANLKGPKVAFDINTREKFLLN